jgi:hypothetical protein
MEGGERIEVEQCTMYCLRDVTQVAEAHAHPLADMEPLVAYQTY